MYLSCFAGMNGLKFLNLNLVLQDFLLKPFTNEFSKTVILNLGLTVKHHHLGVSKNRGTPKWMVYSGRPY